MLLHVSVCDHHQGARTWACIKLQLLKVFGKNTSLWTYSGVAAYYVKSPAIAQSHPALHTAYHYGLDIAGMQHDGAVVV